MEHDRVYREEGLSIGGLAERLGIAEHALRRLINQRLGHRNFNAFLNGYRLDEVIAALGDPAQEAVPILTIALDAGFQSLGPFNRAFKSKTGMTPTEFRREQVVSRFRSSSHFSEPRFELRNRKDTSQTY
jgi:AraC-like DNA-binding protein